MRKQYLIAVILSFSLAASVAQERRVTLLFAGDAMMHTPQIYAAKTDSGYNFHSVFHHVKDQITAADIAGVNLETTFGGIPYSGYPAFSSPTQYAPALHQAGFNIFFTANNHALDTGKKGLEQTIQTIRDLDAKQTGTFVNQKQRNLLYPMMIIKNGIRIALLNYTYGTNGLRATPPNIVNLIDTLQIKKDIAAATLLTPDIIIANMHWGNEYHTQPSTQQKSIAQFLFRHHVRIIIGHHPHVVQPLHIYLANNNNTDNTDSINSTDNINYSINNINSTDSITHAVYYSLGNFVSNQRKPNTDGGMLAHIVLSKAHSNASVTIEQVDYSLVWVHKYFEGDRPVYRILPIQADTTGYNLQPYEQLTMDRFVKSAIKIVQPHLQTIAYPSE